MKYIQRTPEPQALKKAREKKSSWKDLTKNDQDTYNIIVEELHSMQKELCAYCERKIKKEEKKYHVEHFRCRHHFPENQLEWNNLFLSCNDKKTCGTHKDRSKTEKYDVNDLIKPDIETYNPEQYFTYISNGEIKVRLDLNNEDKRKANETIRVFNLNEINLVNRRKKIYYIYEKLFESVNYKDDLESVINIIREMDEFEFPSFIDSRYCAYQKE